jgi:diguanylate cyclase (GGDEF)-like protein
MKLDIHTLFLVTIYVEAILGLLLLFAWAQNLQIRAVAWWGWAHLMRAGSIALFGMYGEVSQAISIDFANALLFLSFAVTWTGARVFDGRKPLPLAIVAGSLVWLIVAHLPVVGSHFEIRFLLASGIITTYTWLTAYEFWRGRAEPLVSRWPAIFMLFAHGSLFLLRTPLAAMLPWPPVSQQFESVWLTVLSFEALMFTISIAFILLAMAKERTEFLHRTAALIDPLTGIANRRSFLNDATELTNRNAATASPTAVLLMDLDHFKSINDRFGHAVGDRVLQIFAESTRETIRAADLFGRLGGEEFAVVLRNVRREDAITLAESIHRHFVEAAAYVDGYATGATVSIGVVISQDPTLDMPELLAQADQALYYAKERGRITGSRSRPSSSFTGAGKPLQRRSCRRRTPPKALLDQSCFIRVLVAGPMPVIRTITSSSLAPS